MRKIKMWRMMTVAAVAASMTCGVFGVQSVSADDKKTLKVAMECGYAPYNWTQPERFSIQQLFIRLRRQTMQRFAHQKKL